MITFPLCIILDPLGSMLSKKMLNCDTNMRYKRVQILDESEPLFEIDTIYVDIQDNVTKLMDRLSGMTVLTRTKDIVGTIQCDDLNMNLVLLTQDSNMLKIFNILQKRMDTLIHWDKELSLEILSKGTFDKMFQLSSNIFSNPILTIDLAFNVTGYGGDFPTNNPFFDDIIINGRFNKESIANIIKRKIISNQDQYTEIRKLVPPNLANCNQYIKSLYYKGTKVGTLIYFCAFTEDISEGEICLIDMLVGYSERLLVQKNKEGYCKQQRIDFLISDLIENKDIPRQEVANRSEMIGLDFTSKYILNVLELSECSVRTINYMVDSLKSVNPHYKVTVYNNQIILLHDIGKDGNYEKTIENKLLWLETYLDEYEALMGVSGIFFSLDAVFNEYKKAKVAVEIGSRMTRGTRIFRYRDYHIYHLLRAASSEIDIHALYYHKLKKLMDLDVENNTDNVEVLKLYLINDRNITRTAELMNLHRNSIVYRVKQIEETLNIDFNIFDERFRMVLALYAQNLIKAFDD